MRTLELKVKGRVQMKGKIEASDYNGNAYVLAGEPKIGEIGIE